MRFVSSFILLSCALLPVANAFLPGTANNLVSARLTNRMPSAVCGLRASAKDASVSRRDLLGSALTFASVLTLQTLPVVADDDHKMSGDYKADVEKLLTKMKAATELKKGDSGMKATVEDARKDMNEFVSYYRRNNKVAGAASFSTLYTAVSTLSGHFQNYGPEYPVPEKRKKRLNQQYAEIEKQLARGR